MDPIRQQLTPDVQNDVISFLRAGAFLRVAVEASGVPWSEFRRWLDLGRVRGSRSPYHVLRTAVMQSQAQGRLRAEAEVFQKSPLLWLKHGPGREKPGRPGWALAARANAAAAGKLGKPLDSPEMQEMFGAFLDATEDVADVRLRLAAVAVTFSGKPKAIPSVREEE